LKTSEREFLVIRGLLLNSHKNAIHELHETHEIHEMSCVSDTSRVRLFAVGDAAAIFSRTFMLIARLCCTQKTITIDLLTVEEACGIEGGLSNAARPRG